MKRFSSITMILGIIIAASTAFAAPPTQAVPRIRLATTTSTENSGLLAYILPEFEKKTGYKVEVVAVGSGAAMKLGENGDADLLMVHARALEDAFIAASFGVDRRDLMYNDFVILGSVKDPAGIKGSKTAALAFARIAASGSAFISRGDKSGTHVKELDIWKIAGGVPNGPWYKEAGQGMEQVIIMADGLQAYTLSDRATYIALKSKIGLKIVYEGEAGLLNPYGVIMVNPARWPSVNVAGAKALMDWLTGDEGRAIIASFKKEGEQLFFLFPKK